MIKLALIAGLMYSSTGYTECQSTLLEDIDRKSPSMRIEERCFDSSEQTLERSIVASGRVFVIPQKEATLKEASIKESLEGALPLVSTGYFVKEGEGLIVDLIVSDEMPQSLPELWVIAPGNGTSGNRSTYRVKLHQGQNAITVKHSGIVYFKHDADAVDTTIVANIVTGGAPLALSDALVEWQGSKSWQQMLNTRRSGVVVEQARDSVKQVEMMKQSLLARQDEVSEQALSLSVDVADLSDDLYGSDKPVSATENRYISDVSYYYMALGN